VRSFLEYRHAVKESAEDEARFERDMKRLMWKYPIYTIIGDPSPGKHTVNQQVEDVYQFSYALKQMGYTDSEVENAKSELSKNWNDFRVNGRFAVEFPVKVQSSKGVPSNVVYSLEHEISDDVTDSYQSFFERRPLWYEKAVAYGIDVGRLEYSEKPRARPSRFNFVRVFFSQPWLTYGGLALVLYGMVASTMVHRAIRMSAFPQ
jgi:hypothetical protein